jgi:hypothetical protein
MKVRTGVEECASSSAKDDTAGEGGSSGSASQGGGSAQGGSGGGSGDWECGAPASRFDDAQGCFENPEDVAEVCGRQLYPESPSAALGPVCVLSAESELWVLTTGASIELMAPSDWKYPAFNGRTFRTYEGWSADETARCQTALGLMVGAYPPYGLSC